jgi:5-enolpyruvylshikimate-3-phosphate synthase
MASIAATTVRPARRIRGTVRLAGDKSISHRYALLAALAEGRSTIAPRSIVSLQQVLKSAEPVPPTAR